MADDSNDSDIQIDVQPAESGRWRFSTREKNWLLDHIKDHREKDVVVSTTADKKIKSRRILLWAEIHDKFIKSAVAEHAWSVDQLLIWWKNTRATTKKSSASFKASVRKTGGGPPPKSQPAEMDQIMSLMGDSTKPLDNPHDSDASFFSKDEVVAADKWSIGKPSEEITEIISAGRKTRDKKEKKLIFSPTGAADMRHDRT